MKILKWLKDRVFFIVVLLLVAACFILPAVIQWKNPRSAVVNSRDITLPERSVITSCDEGTVKQIASLRDSDKNFIVVIETEDGESKIIEINKKNGDLLKVGEYVKKIEYKSPAEYGEKLVIFLLVFLAVVVAAFITCVFII